VPALVLLVPALELVPADPLGEPPLEEPALELVDVPAVAAGCAPVPSLSPESEEQPVLEIAAPSAKMPKKPGV
jgi:hypothetical protein